MQRPRMLEAWLILLENKRLLRQQVLQVFLKWCKIQKHRNFIKSNLITYRMYVCKSVLISYIKIKKTTQNILQIINKLGCFLKRTHLCIHLIWDCITLLVALGCSSAFGELKLIWTVSVCCREPVGPLPNMRSPQHAHRAAFNWKNLE